MYKSLFENKQVGIIYHFTDHLFNILGILKMGMKSDKDTIEYLNFTKTINVHYDPYDNDLNSYSFTRYSKIDSEAFGSIRITLDGDMMSHKYRFINFSKQGKSFRKWAECRIISKLNPLPVIKYITGINIPISIVRANIQQFEEITNICKTKDIKLTTYSSDLYTKLK